MKRCALSGGRDGADSATVRLHNARGYCQAQPRAGSSDAAITGARRFAPVETVEHMRQIALAYALSRIGHHQFYPVRFATHREGYRAVVGRVAYGVLYEVIENALHTRRVQR